MSTAFDEHLAIIPHIAAFGPKVDTPGLGMVVALPALDEELQADIRAAFTAPPHQPTHLWDQASTDPVTGKITVPANPQHPDTIEAAVRGQLVTRLKATIEGLQVQRANLLNQVDELRGELAELRRVRNSSNERMADLAAQLDTAWGEIARLTKGLA